MTFQLLTIMSNSGIIGAFTCRLIAYTTIRLTSTEVGIALKESLLYKVYLEVSIMSRHKKQKKTPFGKLSTAEQQTHIIHDARVLYTTASQAYRDLGVYKQLISAHKNNHPTFSDFGCFWTSTMYSIYYTIQMHLAKIYDTPGSDTITIKQLLKNIETHHHSTPLSFGTQTCNIKLTTAEYKQLQMQNMLPIENYQNNEHFCCTFQDVGKYIAALNVKYDCVKQISEALHTKRNQFLAHHIRQTYYDVNAFLGTCVINIEDMEQLLQVAIDITAGIHQLMTRRGLFAKIANHDDTRCVLALLNTQVDSIDLATSCCDCERLS